MLANQAIRKSNGSKLTRKVGIHHVNLGGGDVGVDVPIGRVFGDRVLVVNVRGWAIYRVLRHRRR